jgi:hypothetical protein
MKKPIPYIYSMFRNFTAIACMFLLQFITFSGFYTLFPCKTERQDTEKLLLLCGNYSAVR